MPKMAGPLHQTVCPRPRDNTFCMKLVVQRTCGGDSGSPWFRMEDGEAFIEGVHVGSWPGNSECGAATVSLVVALADQDTKEIIHSLLPNFPWFSMLRRERR